MDCLQQHCWEKFTKELDLTLFYIWSIYSTFQLIIFKAFQSIYLVEIIRFSKDFVFASCFLIYFFGKNPSILTRSFNLSTLDKLILSFNILVLIFLPFYPSVRLLFYQKLFTLKMFLQLGLYIILEETSILIHTIGIKF